MDLSLEQRELCWSKPYIHSKISLVPGKKAENFDKTSLHISLLTYHNRKCRAYNDSLATTSFTLDIRRSIFESMKVNGTI